MTEDRTLAGWRTRKPDSSDVRSAGPHRRTPRTLAQYDVFLQVLRAAEGMQQGVAELLKLHELTTVQYNVLRILRGAVPDGLPCQQIADRLIKKDPDITRLLDRLERRGLIARGRDARDRRVVRTRITDEGLTLIKALDEPVDHLHEEQLGHLSETQLRQLAQLLGRARQRLPPG